MLKGPMWSHRSSKMATQNLNTSRCRTATLPCITLSSKRKTVGQFIDALKHRAPGQQDFEIKKPFIQGNQVEHIWLSDVQLVGNRFQGRIDNQPRKVEGLKLGQIVSVKPKEISDWLYI